MNKLIPDINNLIKANILLKSKIEELVIADKKNKYPELQNTDAVLAKNIGNLYNILRVLKRRNYKCRNETSKMAIYLSRHSMASLQKVLYRHRTT